MRGHHRDDQQRLALPAGKLTDVQLLDPFEQRADDVHEGYPEHGSDRRPGHAAAAALDEQADARTQHYPCRDRVRAAQPALALELEKRERQRPSPVASAVISAATKTKSMLMRLTSMGYAHRRQRSPQARRVSVAHAGIAGRPACARRGRSPLPPPCAKRV